METTYERLETLAKEEYDNRIKALNVTELEKQLYKSKDYVFMPFEKKNRYIANKIFRPAMKEYMNDPEKCLAYIKEICGEMWDLKMSVSQLEKRKSFGYADQERVEVGELLEVTFLVNPTEHTTVYGYVGCQKYGYDVVDSLDHSVNTVDLPTFFAGLYQYREIYNECERLRALSPEEREKEIGYKHVLEYFQKYRVYNWFDSVEERAQYCEKCRNRVKAYQATHKKRYWYNLHFEIAHRSDCIEANTYFYHLFLQMMNGEIPILSYCEMIDYCPVEKIGWRVMNKLRRFSFLGELLNPRILARASIIVNYDSYRRLASDYAKSYVTKKNQSEKLKTQIKESLLHQYFGYVEYDENVDINAIRQYEQEFQVFYEKHLRGVDLSTNAVRFRRLGHHRADGMYFPHVKCLCVDIHGPHSMVHEMGHLIDYQFGCLSSEKEFAEVYDMAQKHIQRCEESDEKLAKELKRNSKYNKTYYLTPTEVFARSFELYTRYVLEEKSSLLEAEYGEIYDISPENLEMVKTYFEGLFRRVKKEIKGK